MGLFGRGTKEDRERGSARPAPGPVTGRGFGRLFDAMRPGDHPLDPTSAHLIGYLSDKVDRSHRLRGVLGMRDVATEEQAHQAFNQSLEVSYDLILDEIKHVLEKHGSASPSIVAGLLLWLIHPSAGATVKVAGQDSLVSRFLAGQNQDNRTNAFIILQQRIIGEMFSSARWTGTSATGEKTNFLLGKWSSTRINSMWFENITQALVDSGVNLEEVCLSLLSVAEANLESPDVFCFFYALMIVVSAVETGRAGSIGNFYEKYDQRLAMATAKYKDNLEENFLKLLAIFIPRLAFKFPETIGVLCHFYNPGGGEVDRKSQFLQNVPTLPPASPAHERLGGLLRDSRLRYPTVTMQKSDLRVAERTVEDRKPNYHKTGRNDRFLPSDLSALAQLVKTLHYDHQRFFNPDKPDDGLPFSDVVAPLILALALAPLYRDPQESYSSPMEAVTGFNQVVADLLTDVFEFLGKSDDKDLLSWVMCSMRCLVSDQFQIWHELAKAILESETRVDDKTTASILQGLAKVTSYMAGHHESFATMFTPRQGLPDIPLFDLNGLIAMMEVVLGLVRRDAAGHYNLAPKFLRRFRRLDTYPLPIMRFGLMVAPSDRKQIVSYDKDQPDKVTATLIKLGRAIWAATGIAKSQGMSEQHSFPSIIMGQAKRESRLVSEQLSLERERIDAKQQFLADQLKLYIGELESGADDSATAKSIRKANKLLEQLATVPESIAHDLSFPNLPKRIKVGTFRLDSRANLLGDVITTLKNIPGFEAATIRTTLADERAEATKFMAEAHRRTFEDLFADLERDRKKVLRAEILLQEVMGILSRQL